MRNVMLTIGALALLAAPAPGQGGHSHRGFWIAFGLGGGANVTEGLDQARLGGGAGFFRIGGTPSQRWLVGFEGLGWGRGRGDDVVSRGNGTFTVMFFPSEDGGGFLKGGAGGASLSLVRVEGNTTSTTTYSGFGLTLGAGYDLRLGRNLYLTPNVDWLLQVFDPETDPILGPIPDTNSILTLTIGLTWH
jgi:hypothetical protein